MATGGSVRGRKNEGEKPGGFSPESEEVEDDECPRYFPPMRSRTRLGASGLAATDCVTLKLWPAIVSVPVRAEDVPLGEAVKDNVAPPLPLVGVTASQVAAVPAVHEQPALEVSVTVPVPPAAVNA